MDILDHGHLFDTYSHAQFANCIGGFNLWKDYVSRKNIDLQGKSLTQSESLLASLLLWRKEWVCRFDYADADGKFRQLQFWWFYHFYWESQEKYTRNCWKNGKKCLKENSFFWE